MSISTEASTFLAQWLRSRPGHLIHRAAAIAILVVAVTLPAVFGPPPSTLVLRYRKAGFAALRRDKPEVAELYFRRVGRLDPNDPAGRFGMALTAEKQGNSPMAERLMHSLAYCDDPYPLAHNWLAEKLLKSNRKLSEDDFWQVQKHLEVAVRASSARVQAHSLLGKMLISRSEFHEAIPHLAAVVERAPELRLPLAKAYRATGSHDKAKFEIDSALSYFRSLSLAAPGDPNPCLFRVRCEILAGEKATAERVLRRAQDRFPDDNRFTNLLQNMHLAACDAALSGNSLDLAMKHLESAVKLDPAAGSVLQRLSVLASRSGDSATQATEQLRQVAVSGVAPTAAHLALGGAMLRRGDSVAARKHFELALKHDANNAITLNNLAWCILRDMPEQAERALELVDTALGVKNLDRARRAEILETRGQILTKLDRWSEAVIDLERALPRLKDRTETHSALEQAYAELQQPELAASHRKQFQMLTEARSATKTRN